MKNIYLKIAEYTDRLPGLSLATVITSHGSTPQKPGSSALFGTDGLLCGTVGGGVLEGRVTSIALEAASKGGSGIYKFDFANDISAREEAICGGNATVLISSDAVEFCMAASEAAGILSEGRFCILTTSVRLKEDRVLSMRRRIIDPVSDVSDIGLTGDVEAAIRKMTDERKRNGFSVINVTDEVNRESDLTILELLLPPEKLVIAGAGHIGKALSHLANLLDFEVTVIDDRAEYASKTNIPEADRIVVEEIGSALERVRKGPDTYIVIVTRGHSDDGKALRSCIGSNARYIGMIGSGAKITKMKHEFISNGWATNEQWNSIHAPVGLEIGSQTVEEIAVSIAAELVLVRSRK